jgi:hypothetical protein
MTTGTTVGKDLQEKGPFAPTLPVGILQTPGLTYEALCLYLIQRAGHQIRSSGIFSLTVRRWQHSRISRISSVRLHNTIAADGTLGLVRSSSSQEVLNA